MNSYTLALTRTLSELPTSGKCEGVLFLICPGPHPGHFQYSGLGSPSLSERRGVAAATRPAVRRPQGSGMPALAQALVAVALVSTAIVAAAPTQEKAVRRVAVSSESRPQKIEGTRRRAKRQILVEEAPFVDEEEELKQELSELSDSQLRVLADIVQDEIERYNDEDPRGGQEEYEIIEIPDEVITPGRMRRSESVLDSVPELVVVPDEMIEEALEEQEEDLELRTRIAEIAQILNERASRRRL